MRVKLSFGMQLSWWFLRLATKQQHIFFLDQPFHFLPLRNLTGLSFASLTKSLSPSPRWLQSADSEVCATGVGSSRRGGDRRAPPSKMFSRLLCFLAAIIYLNPCYPRDPWFSSLSRRSG